MDGQQYTSISEISAQNLLEKIVCQDVLWWEENGEVREYECKLTKLGNMVQAVHDHFRKLEPEYCLKVFEDNMSQTETSSETVKQDSDTDVSENFENEETMSPLPLESLQSSQNTSVQGFAKSRTFPRIAQQERKRYMSLGAQRSTPMRIARRPSAMRESLALGRSPQIRDLDSSLESVHSKGSDPMPAFGGVIRVANLNVYRAASLCCNYPVLMRERAQERGDEDSSQLDILPKKDENRSVAEHLDMYLRKIFRISKKKHRQYQTFHSVGDSDQSKRENLEQTLRHQLMLLETDSNPYYQPRNFQSSIDYKKWQDSERQEINALLKNRVPAFRGRHRHDSTPRNRCDEYRELLKKAMTYDAECNRNKISSKGSLRSGEHSGSESSSSHRAGSDEILSKWGRRLLGEYAARYRVTTTTQICFYLEITEECLKDQTLKFDAPVFKTLKAKLEKLCGFIEDGCPLCTSEFESIITVTARFIEWIKGLVITLLTKWLPTTDQLCSGLELAATSFKVLDTLKENDTSNWPECLSKWFEEATIEKYHSCKRADFKAIPETVLASVTHAVNVMKLMQKRDSHSEQTNYEAVFSEYISNFPQPVSSGLYEAVMADVRLLAKALPWIKSAPPVVREDGSGISSYFDSLDLSDIALAYKLAEFDNLVKIREIDAMKQNQHERNFSWRMAYHQLAMHWLDVLSCHMRRQVICAVVEDRFLSPDFNELQETVVFGDADIHVQDTIFQSKKFRLGSLIKKENTEDEETIKPPDNTNLEELEEEECSDGEKSDLEDTQPPKTGPEVSRKERSNNKELSTSKHLPDGESPSCILLSYKGAEIVGEEESRSESFHSCVPGTGESSSAAPKFTSVTDSSNKTFSTATSHSEEIRSESSNVISEDDSSGLPELISARIPPQDLDERFPSGHHFNEHSTLLAAGDEEVLCNVSSSIIDVIAVITRFTRFTQTIIETVYSLPSAESPSDFDVSFPSIGGYSRCTEATILTEMKDRFIQKAIEALCCVVQQYANNLLSIDISCVPRNTATVIIGRKLFQQIINGKFNKTISRQNSTTPSYMILPGQSETQWDERKACQMIIRLNNLLVLEHGLPLFWKRLEKLTSLSYDHKPSRLSSMPSTFVPVQLPDAEHFPSISSDYDRNQGGVSSDETPKTSSSTKTAIYCGESDDQNNNNNEDSAHSSKLKYPEYENVSIPASGIKLPAAESSADDVESPVYENMTFAFRQRRIGSFQEEDDISEEISFTKTTLDYLKEGTENHLNICTRGSSRLIVVLAGNWFCQILYMVLDHPPGGKNSTKDEEIETLLSQLSFLLDTFMKWTHKEGIDELHRLLWMQIIQDVKYKISLLREVDSAVSKIHAEHIRKVFKMVLDAWYRHPSKPNAGDLDWLTEPIRPSLTVLELYCMSTPSLVGMYRDCKMEGDVNPDHYFDPSVDLHCRDIVVLCIRELQERKSFSGKTLHRALLRILEERNQYSSDTASASAENFCREMLAARLIEFVFRKCVKEKLPDLIPVEHAIEQDRKDRSESLSTGTSQQSSLVTEDSYSGESSETDLQRIFHCDASYFYRFSRNRLLLSIIDDVRLATNSSAVEDDSFLLNLLRMRSQTDKEAKLFLLENGYIQRGMIKSCLSCFS